MTCTSSLTRTMMPHCQPATAASNTHHKGTIHCGCTHATMWPHCSLQLHAANNSEHAALHGNAFNPNMGKIAEYGTLSYSSDGFHWQAASTAEIHCLTQGIPAVLGTNTMFFIPVTVLPARHKSHILVHHLCTLPRDISASPCLLDCWWQPVMMEMSAPKLPT